MDKTSIDGAENDTHFLDGIKEAAHVCICVLIACSGARPPHLGMLTHTHTYIYILYNKALRDFLATSYPVWVGEFIMISAS